MLHTMRVFIYSVDHSAWNKSVNDELQIEESTCSRSALCYLYVSCGNADVASDSKVVSTSAAPIESPKVLVAVPKIE